MQKIINLLIIEDENGYAPVGHIQLLKKNLAEKIFNYLTSQKK